MSVRSEKAAAPTNPLAAIDGGDATASLAPEALAEGNSFNVANPDHPIERNVVVSIKATLNDFCLQKTRGTWAPTQEALRSICKLTRALVSHFSLLCTTTHLAPHISHLTYDSSAALV